MGIHEVQFGFMLGCGTANTTFILRGLQEKHLAKKNILYFAFVDLEKAFDHQFPRNVVWRALKKLGEKEWLLTIAQLMYGNAQRSDRVNVTFIEDFQVQKRLHQGSVLSHLLFIIFLEALFRKIKWGCPEELLCADDLTLFSETLQSLKGRQEAWKRALE